MFTSVASVIRCRQAAVHHDAPEHFLRPPRAAHGSPHVRAGPGAPRRLRRSRGLPAARHARLHWQRGRDGELHAADVASARRRARPARDDLHGGTVDATTGRDGAARRTTAAVCRHGARHERKRNDEGDEGEM